VKPVRAVSVSADQPCRLLHHQRQAAAQPARSGCIAPKQDWSSRATSTPCVATRTTSKRWHGFRVAASAAIVSPTGRQGSRRGLQAGPPVAHPEHQTDAVNPRSEPCLWGPTAGPLAGWLLRAGYCYCCCCRKRSGPLAGLERLLCGARRLFCLQPLLWQAAPPLILVHCIGAATRPRGAVSSSAGSAVFSRPCR